VAHLVEVAFKGNRKEFFLWDYPDPPPLKAAVIVDVDRGEDLGYVHAFGEAAQKRSEGCAHGCGTGLPERKALRLATEKDRGLSNELNRLNEDARRKAMERVRANGLGMKLSDAEWQWDRKKLTLYFTADKRVDFRNLVRDLASLFRTRIELKQIGVRDEAKRLDGIGRCGRQYCSASWLPELRPVNLGVAKDQRLSLNPSQISGACGRLMCCLRYEHEFYVQSRKRFPKEGKIVATSLGEEKVVSIDIFHERVALRGVEGELRSITLVEFKQETEQAAAGGAPVAADIDEDERGLEGIQADEISPELMYTAEHQIPAPRTNVVSEVVNTNGRDTDGANKRRRGRRGGRRGRGEDSQSGNQ
jgi:cell fate regulator YaaT (PSP1 superfamily)